MSEQPEGVTVVDREDGTQIIYATATFEVVVATGTRRRGEPLIAAIVQAQANQILTGTLAIGGSNSIGATSPMNTWGWPR